MVALELREHREVHNNGSIRGALAFAGGSRLRERRHGDGDLGIGRTNERFCVKSRKRQARGRDLNSQTAAARGKRSLEILRGVGQGRGSREATCRPWEGGAESRDWEFHRRKV